MANELKYHMNMLNSIDKKVGGPGNWTYIIDALNSIDQNLSSYIPDQKQEIVDELNDAISEIQATGEAVKDSIPSDYTALEQATYNAYPTQSETGNPIYFDDGADDIPVKSLSVDLVPKQDLHGYDHPWIGGSGKNKLPNAVAKAETSNGITVTLDSNGVYTIKGTATEQALCKFPVGYSFTIYSGEPNPKFCMGNSSSNARVTFIFYNNGAVVDSWSAVGVNRVSEYTGMQGQQCNEFGIKVLSGTTVDMTIKPMFVENSVTDYTYEPYSNICPISGYDGVKVKRTGKNLLPMTLANLKAWNTRGTWSGNVYTDTTTVTFTVQTNSNELVTGIVANGTATNASVFYIRAHDLKSGNYIVNGAPSGGEWASKYRIRIGDKTDAFIDQDVGTDRNIPVTNGLTLQIKTAIGYACNNLVFKPMIRLASATDSTFEPYTEQEYSITFPTEVGTVYGGSLNATTGVLTVDRKGVDLGTLSWTERASGTHQWLAQSPSGSISIVGVTSALCISDRYVRVSKTNTLPSNGKFLFNASSLSANHKLLLITDTSYSSATEFKNGVTGSIFIYPLDGALTYQLTPTEVSTLLGNNTISSDGSINLTYRADTTMVIEKLTNAIVSLGGNV
jgi:hypothetical protein